jgi:hypothetical protein
MDMSTRSSRSEVSLVVQNRSFHARFMSIET